MSQCQIHKISQYRCPRKATTFRVTNAGVEIPLCGKCDSRYGAIIGKHPESEMCERQLMIDTIEGYVGTLNSVPYAQISTEDLDKLASTIRLLAKE